MAFWAYISETAHQILMIFSHMLDIIALNGPCVTSGPNGPELNENVSENENGDS